MGALVHVLEAAPPADVVDQYPAEIGAARAYIGDKLLEPVALVDLQTAESVVSVGPNDVEIIVRGIGGNRGRLIFDRIPLVRGRHPHVLGGALGELAPKFRQLCATYDQRLCHRSTSGHSSRLKFCAQTRA